MSYLSAERFAERHGGIEGLIKFIEMSNRLVDGKEIAKVFNMTPGNVTQLQKKLGKFTFQPTNDVLDYIVNKSGDRIEGYEKNLDFARKQRAKVIPHDFRSTLDERNTA